MRHPGPVDTHSPGRQSLIDDLGRNLAGALIALDFDGTLAPLVLDPTTSRPADGAHDAIAALAERGADVVIITGRGAATAVELSGLSDVERLSVHGLYGAERWQGGRISTQPDSPAIERARSRVRDAVAATDGSEEVWIEDKRLSLVVHTRRSPDPAEVLERLRPAVTAIAADCGLETHDGHFVLELRLPGFDKGKVLATLVSERTPEAVLFCGDDVGDVPAFELIADLRRRGVRSRSVLVGAGTPVAAGLADVRLDTPADLVVLLQEIADYPTAPV